MKDIIVRTPGCPKCGKLIICSNGAGIIECMICGHIWPGRRAEDDKLLTCQEARRDWC